MKSRMFVTLLILILALPVHSQNILLWKNVGQSVFVSPETGADMTADYNIRVSLAVNYRSFEVVDSLPENLSGYDIIFITLGFAVDCG